MYGYIRFSLLRSYDDDNTSIMTRTSCGGFSFEISVPPIGYGLAFALCLYLLWLRSCEFCVFLKSTITKILTGCESTKIAHSHSHAKMAEIVLFCPFLTIFKIVFIHPLIYLTISKYSFIHYFQLQIVLFGGNDYFLCALYIGCVY